MLANFQEIETLLLKPSSSLEDEINAIDIKIQPNTKLINITGGLIILFNFL